VEGAPAPEGPAEGQQRDAEVETELGPGLHGSEGPGGEAGHRDQGRFSDMLTTSRHWCWRPSKPGPPIPPPPPGSHAPSTTNRRHPAPGPSEPPGRTPPASGHHTGDGPNTHAPERCKFNTGPGRRTPRRPRSAVPRHRLRGILLVQDVH